MGDEKYEGMTLAQALVFQELMQCLTKNGEYGVKWYQWQNIQYLSFTDRVKLPDPGVQFLYLLTDGTIMAPYNPPREISLDDAKIYVKERFRPKP